MKNLFVAVAILCANFCISQSKPKPFEISGTVISANDGASLESATVYLEEVKDSSLVTYTITNSKGFFSLENETNKTQLKLSVSYVGYKTYSKVIDIKKKDILLDKILMDVDDNALEEVIIRSKAPITIKKDTLEFNVKSFKTKKDANVEDLLKVLPGVEVDDDGSIKVNGKSVSRILVNGKPFFGNDPTITTRNLTKDIIEKVQVVNTKTKSQAFTGEEGDEENKTINLTIKKENNKGVFGRVSGGVGTDKRYEFAGMFNRFDNDQRISILAGGNNINSPGFSFGEIRKMFGGSSISYSSNGSFSVDGRSFGGGQGLVTSRNAGVNYADDFGDSIELSSDYFYSSSSSENRSSSQRENILPDRRFFSSSESYSLNDNSSHRTNTELDVELSPTLILNIEPSFTYTKNESINSRESSSRNENNELTNQSTSNSFVETLGKRFENDISLTQKFGDKWGYIRFNMGVEIGQRDGDDYLSSEANIFGDTPEDIIRDQYADRENNNTSYSTRINYNIPIIEKKLFFDLGYRYRRQKQENRRSTFDRDSSNDYTIFNTELSTDFEYINGYREPEISLRYRTKKISARFQTSYLYRDLESKDYLRPELNLKRSFQTTQMNSSFNYRFSSKASLRFRYRLTNRVPQINQLQAFQNVSNPLNVVIGNPDLEPMDSHNFSASFNNYDFQKKIGLYSYITATFDNNQVVSRTVINDNLTRETTYDNVDGNYRLNGNISYNKSVELDSLRTLRFSLSAYGRISKRINFNNNVQYASETKSINPSVGLRFNWKKVFEFNPRYRANITKTTFDLDTFSDREFVSHNLSLSTATFVPKNLEWRNEVRYNYNPNVGEDFQKSSWFWNATLTYSLLKDKASLTLKAYDILNQNTNARRIANENFIQDSQSSVLQRYFMLGFNWKFNSLGKKGEVKEYNFRF